MHDGKNEINFTGEYFIPGKSDQRIESDHMARYRFALRFAEGKSVLDIACGVGYSGPLFLKAGAASYDGVDINDKLIEYAKKTYGADLINYFIGDICKFSNHKTYDLISCFETIEHVEKYEAAIKNLYSLLNLGGTLLISSPNRRVTSPNAATLKDKPSNEFHTQEFIPEELLSILNENGFTSGRDKLYGQRQRKTIYRNRYYRKIIYTVFGNPDIKKSPEVTKVVDKIPRYFIIVATKK